MLLAASILHCVFIDRALGRVFSKRSTVARSSARRAATWAMTFAGCADVPYDVLAGSGMTRWLFAIPMSDGSWQRTLLVLAQNFPG
jgi:hypothetical protein